MTTWVIGKNKQTTVFIYLHKNCIYYYYELRKKEKRISNMIRKTWKVQQIVNFFLSYLHQLLQFPMKNWRVIMYSTFSTQCIESFIELPMVRDKWTLNILQFSKKHELFLILYIISSNSVRYVAITKHKLQNKTYVLLLLFMSYCKLNFFKHNEQVNDKELLRTYLHLTLLLNNLFSLYKLY